MQRAARKWAPIAFIVLAAIELVWVLVGNFFLNTTAMRALVNRKPEKIRIEWETARTWWPGDLRVTKLVIRGDQLTMQWALELDRSRAQVGMLALLGKRFAARDLVAHGGTFRLRRHPVTENDMRREKLVAPIPWAAFEQRPAGFDAKAIVEAEKRPPDKRIWAVDLPGFHGDGIREIWIDEYRYAGDASVSGTWFLRAKEKNDLDSLAIVLAAGRVHFGEETVLEVKRGSAEAAMPDVDLVEHRGAETTAFLDGKVSLEGDVPNVRFVDFYLGRFPGLDIQSGPGTLAVQLESDGGAVTGTLALSGRNVDARWRGVDFRGDLQIDTRVKKWELAGTVRDLSGTRGAIRDARLAGDKGGTATDDWWGEVELERATISGGDAWSLTAEVTARVKDTRPLIAALEARRDLWESVEDALVVRDVKARASIYAKSGEAKIPDLEVTGNDFVLKSRMWLREDEDPKAIAYVKRGKLSIGIERGGKRNVKITKPRDWFEKHPLLRMEAE